VVSALRRESFEHFALIIDGAPEVFLDVVDTEEHLIDVPSPKRIRLLANAPFPDFCGDMDPKQFHQRRAVS
jgi:hypothetical protein